MRVYKPYFHLVPLLKVLAIANPETPQTGFEAV